MTVVELQNLLIEERDWRVNEIEFCRKIPFVYTNLLFRNHISKFWRICIPMIYAHWEGFVIASIKLVVDYINSLNISYSYAPNHLILLDNKRRFGYLQGNCSIDQQQRFLSEFLDAQSHGICIDRTAISANSNLNYAQLEKLFRYFDLTIPPNIEAQKAVIEKLVWYRNSIAHGENGISVVQNDIENFISSIMICFDEIIHILLQYAVSLNTLVQNYNDSN